jgi:RNA polymerase sigma factor for flagellar operon FliA
MPSSRVELEQLFLAELPRIDRVLARLCRQFGLFGDDADDFSSWARERLIENDYAVLAKFRGESSLSTYLTVVLARCLREYRIAKFGRWRPSAAARRRGIIAVHLEALVHRDGLALSQAGEMLRTAALTQASDKELGDLLMALPRRYRARTEIHLDARVEPVDSASADYTVLESELEHDLAQTGDAIRNALDHLEPEDRVVVQMRFWEGLSVADIARALRLDQKPLYRRLERSLRELRARLESSGIDRTRLRDLWDQTSV